MDELEMVGILKIKIIKMTEEAIQKSIAYYENGNEAAAYFKGFTDGIEKTFNMIEEFMIKESQKALEPLNVTKTETGKFN